jgi:hypothetical protein
MTASRYATFWTTGRSKSGKHASRSCCPRDPRKEWSGPSGVTVFSTLARRPSGTHVSSFSSTTLTWTRCLCLLTSSTGHDTVTTIHC